MRTWTPISATLAPVVLIGGWTAAAALQPASYDQVRDSISALAGPDATAPWLMTACFVVVGLCHLATAWGLRESRPGGRAVLALGGLATLAVAALPLPSAGHLPAATVAFGALTLWPLLGRAPGTRSALAAAAVLAVLTAWMVAALVGEQAFGLAERTAAGAQALWPAVAVWWARRRDRTPSQSSGD